MNSGSLANVSMTASGLEAAPQNHPFPPKALTIRSQSVFSWVNNDRLAERHGVLSLELPGFSQSHHMSDQLPKLFVTEDDSTGVLLGGPEPDFPTRLDDMPLSPVRLVPVVLITASELEYVRSGGREAREDLVNRLKSAGVGHTSSLHRASVV